MKRLTRWPLLLILAAASLFAQAPQFLHTYEENDKTLVLGICYPTRYALNSIIALRNEGFLPTEHLQVVGLYHEAEDSDYAGARRWAEAEGLDWLAYHEVQGELNLENIWKENACSAEFARIFDKLHGLILFGGADIPPYVYGEKTQLLTGISTPARHFFEASLVFHLLGGSQDSHQKALLEKNPQFPILGICLGEQTINVGTGGTLIQDIWFQKYGKSTVEDVVALGRDQWHNNPWAKLFPKQGLLRYTMHPIKIKGKSVFTEMMGLSKNDRPRVISSHHQMADKLGLGIRVIATSVDGKVPEAIAHTRFPNVLGVQFHPEFETLYNPDVQARITPKEAPFSLRSVLEDNPPSYAFHRALWQWFVSNIEAQHAR